MPFGEESVHVNEIEEKRYWQICPDKTLQARWHLFHPFYFGRVFACRGLLERWHIVGWSINTFGHFIFVIIPMPTKQTIWKASLRPAPPRYHTGQHHL